VSNFGAFALSSHYKLIHFKNKNSKTEKYYAQVKINIFTENCTVQFTEF
jgi:hypothetical protein